MKHFKEKKLSKKNFILNMISNHLNGKKSKQKIKNLNMSHLKN